MGQLPKKTKMAREATMMAECHNEYYFKKSVSKKRCVLYCNSVMFEYQSL